MANLEMVAKVEELKELKTMKAELEKEITAIEDSLKQESLERGVEELIVGNFIVRFTKVLTTRFDSTAFKKEHEDIYNIFTKVSESRRFSIS